MERRNVALGLVVSIGCSLVGYGLVVGDEATHELSVESVNEEELQDDVSVTEYDYLSPRMQDAFRNGIGSEGFVEGPELPEGDIMYVHYRDSYYRISTVHGDAAQTTMFFSIAGGIGVILLGSLGWFVARRWSNQSSS